MPQPAADRFRATVRKLMDERGVTIADLARSIGSARPGISRVLAGKDFGDVDKPNVKQNVQRRRDRWLKDFFR